MKKTILIIWMVALAVNVLTALTLEQSLDLARKNNKELLSAQSDIVIADQTYKEVRGMLLPQLTLQGAYQLNTTWLPDSAIPPSMDFAESLDEFASANDSTLAEIMTGFYTGMIPQSPMEEGSLAGQIKLDQIVFSGGKLINGVKAVKRYRSIQKLRYQLLEQEIVVKTTDMFYQTVLAKKVYEIQQEALTTANRHLNRVELLNQEGQISDFDLLRARLEVAKLSPDVVKARNNYHLALNAFSNQIGFTGPELTLESEFVVPELRAEDLDAALALAETQRIELELISINTEISKIKYNAEQGNYLPNVALTAGYSLYTAADEYKIERDDFGTAFNVGIGFSIPLFTGLSNTARRINAKHGYIQAQLKEADTRELIALEVRQAWQNLQHAIENYNVQLENIQMAERNLQLAQVRFENQIGIQLEVFDAQMMLNSIKLSYNNSVYELISANQKFKKAMGFIL
ncbi:MAG: TolC family protein [Candidatus Cloacimonadaceae bacterium]